MRISILLYICIGMQQYRCRTIHLYFTIPICQYGNTNILQCGFRRNQLPDLLLRLALAAIPLGGIVIIGFRLFLAQLFFKRFNPFLQLFDLGLISQGQLDKLSVVLPGKGCFHHFGTELLRDFPKFHKTDMIHETVKQLIGIAALILAA